MIQSRITIYQFKQNQNMKETRKLVSNSGVWEKRYELMRKKIAASTQIVHNQFQYQIESLQQENEELERSIKAASNSLRLKVIEISRNYSKEITSAAQWYANPQKEPPLKEALTLEEVKKYLNTEKWVLHQLLETKESKPSELDYIHHLQKQSELQEILEEVELKQIQKQVQYLCTHVITGSGLVFVPEQTGASEVQEKELNAKISFLLSEVERLVNSHVGCIDTTGRSSSNDVRLMEALEEQEARLEKVFDMLSSEKAAIQKMETGLEDVESRLRQVPLFVAKTSRQTGGVWNRHHINQQEITFIAHHLNMEEPEMVSSQVNEYEQLSAKLKLMQSKLKMLG